MRSATYIPPLALAGCLLALAGCSSDATDEKPPGNTLTIYQSLPRQGISARTADAVAAGARLALADAGGHAGGKRVRLVELDSSKPGGDTWDPSMVESNAHRAAEDPTTIAYLGELDSGASAISVPITNDEGILQVAPLDGLTSLTRLQPGASIASRPDRYYPSGERTFLRLVPGDNRQAHALLAWARQRGASRIAVVQDGQLSGRELGAQVRFLAPRHGLTVVDGVEARDDTEGYPGLAGGIASKQPDAVIYTGAGSATSGALLATLQQTLPEAPLFGASTLATAEPAPAGLPPVSVVKPALPARAYGPRARRVLARIGRERGAVVPVEALYGYEAMRVILDAIADGGGEGADRASVVHAALAPRARLSVIGRYRVLPGGEVSSTRFGSYRRDSRTVSYTGSRGSPAASP